METNMEPARLRFNILVIGPKKSGKTLLAGKLGARLGVQVVETSDVLVEEGAVLLASMFPTQYPTLAEARAKLLTKGQTERVCLFALGDLMTTLKPDCLIDGATREARPESCGIIVGPRRKVELEAWFGNDVKGWRHTLDVLIEVRDPENKDAQFELTDWHCRQGGAVKFFLYNMPEEFDELAEQMAAEIRKLV